MAQLALRFHCLLKSTISTLLPVALALGCIRTGELVATQRDSAAGGSIGSRDSAVGDTGNDSGAGGARDGAARDTDNNSGAGGAAGAGMGGFGAATDGAIDADGVSGGDAIGADGDGAAGSEAGTCPDAASPACASPTVYEHLYLECADPEWAEWPVPNAEADAVSNHLTRESYVGNDDLTVTDAVTGLMWQLIVGQTLPEPDALLYCQGLSLGGYCDWRLPTDIELVSLVDPGSIEPAVSTTYFSNVPTDLPYWTSTRAKDWPDKAWYVDFFFGYTDFYNHTLEDRLYVRCVR